MLSDLSSELPRTLGDVGAELAMRVRQIRRQLEEADQDARDRRAGPAIVASPRLSWRDVPMPVMTLLDCLRQSTSEQRDCDNLPADLVNADVIAFAVAYNLVRLLVPVARAPLDGSCLLTWRLEDYRSASESLQHVLSFERTTDDMPRASVRLTLQGRSLLADSRLSKATTQRREISGAVVVTKYSVSKATLRRKLKEGTLTDLRPPSKRRNTPYLFAEDEIASKFELR